VGRLLYLSVCVGESAPRSALPFDTCSEQGRNNLHLGVGYCTEQNADGIPSFVHCRLLRNGNHTFHQKSWGGPSKFFFGGGGRTHICRTYIATVHGQLVANGKAISFRIRKPGRQGM